MLTCKRLPSPSATHKHTALIIPVMASMVIKLSKPTRGRGGTGPIGRTFGTIGFAIKGNFISGFAKVLHSGA